MFLIPKSTASQEPVYFETLVAKDVTGRVGGRRREVAPSPCGAEGDPSSGTAPAVTHLCRERGPGWGVGLGRMAGQNRGPAGLSLYSSPYQVGALNSLGPSPWLEPKEPDLLCVPPHLHELTDTPFPPASSLP